MASRYSKSTIPSPTVAVSRNKTINLQKLLEGSQTAAKQFQSGKEVMLNVERVVLRDGSVMDIFHHTNAKNAQ